MENSDPTIILNMLFGFIIGFSPYAFKALKDRREWGTKKEVVQADADKTFGETLQSMAMAQRLLYQQSIELHDKNSQLVTLYEDAMGVQKEIADNERFLREQLTGKYESQQEEIGRLRIQISQLTEKVVDCSRDILDILEAIADGEKIRPEKINNIRDRYSLVE